MIWNKFYTNNLNIIKNQTYLKMKMLMVLLGLIGLALSLTLHSQAHDLSTVTIKLFSWILIMMMNLFNLISN